VIAKSFARIHETNLKKQGVLALKFANPEDYEKILEDDRISILDLQTFEQDKSLRGIIHHGNANDEEISLVHSYNSSQIKWFKAGSALNLMRMK
jgi:aconitate hydratase